MSNTSVEVIIPALNESASIADLLTRLRQSVPEASLVVVDDGSTDDTAAVAESHGARVVTHPYTIGNGGSVKDGARGTKAEVCVFMDADGQHPPESIPEMLDKLTAGYDMVVGARNRTSQASWGRSLANAFYNWLATRMTGHRVLDLTSGFRVVHARRFREFLHLLPNGFSYPTTITMAFFRAGYRVGYVPIDGAQRKGKSHIRPVRDALRFLLIIFRIATLYSPLKLFFPVSALFFVLGVGYSSYTLVEMGRFTNMSALLFSMSILIFLIGLVSEQITALVYQSD